MRWNCGRRIRGAHPCLLDPACALLRTLEKNGVKIQPNSGCFHG
jgi:hypothetical protein